MNRQLAEAQLKKWLDFREQFLRKSAPLKCHYCGREGLQIKVPEAAMGHKLGSLATVDHVVPLSKGGAEFDESNCVVACFSCNQKKGDKFGV